MRKESDLTRRRMLVVSDSSEELADLRYLLSGEFGEYMESVEESAALNLFMKYHPPVLILAFRSLETSEQFYLTLYRRDERIHEVLHQTVLLCKGSESEQAYRLCKKGTIDDFVADRPLYDPFRLRLSVAQALKRHSQARYIAAVSGDLADLTHRLRQFDEIIGQRLSLGGGQHRQTMHAFQRFTRDLGDDLTELQETLKGRRAAAPAAGKEVDAHFASFRKKSLETGGDAVLRQMSRTDSVFKEMKDDYDEYSESLRRVGHKPGAPRVLLVDDDEMFREILATMLRDAGMEPLEAGDGSTALTALQLATPDVILLDYLMPGIDGLATLKEIKANPSTREIPVVMLTGAGAREVVAESVKAGAKGFIVKPSDRETILSRIHTVLGGTG